MIVTREMIDPEIRLRGRIVDLINTRSTERRYLKHVRRTRYTMRLLAGRSLAGVHSQEIRVPRSDGGSTIRVRVMSSPAKNRRDRAVPGVLWIHGGGYAIGVPEMDSRVHRMLVQEYGYVVIAPDYRLSIDAPYPAALDDCYDTLLWMRDHADELGIRSDRLKEAGVPVRFRVFERCFHAFDIVHPNAAVSLQARRFWTAALPTGDRRIIMRHR